MFYELIWCGGRPKTEQTGCPNCNNRAVDRKNNMEQADISSANTEPTEGF